LKGSRFGSDTRKEEKKDAMKERKKVRNQWLLKACHPGSFGLFD
jgi:hypothetical protein